MARVPFFESTWRRKARLTGVVLGVYAVVRLLALLSDKLAGLGWSDIPVSLLVLIYLAFLYVEVWIILERHTRPAFSIVAAALLAGLCLASPFIAFDPVAIGSIPDRMRFWEPMRGLPRPAGQRIVLLERSMVDGPVQEAREALERSEEGLLAAVGLPAGASLLAQEERAAFEPQLTQLATQAGLTPPRAKLWAASALLQLEKGRAEVTLALIEQRVACLARLAAGGTVLPVTPEGGEEQGAGCGAVRRQEVRVAPGDAAAALPAQAGPVTTFLEQLAAQGEQWLEAGKQGAKPAGGGVLFRFQPAELEGKASFVALLAAPVTERRKEEWSKLEQALERHGSALHRFLALQQETGLLEAQLALIPLQLRTGLAGQTVLDRGKTVPTWQLADSPGLSSLMARGGLPELTRLLDARPRHVLDYAATLPEERQEVFFGYLAQTQHWHLRDPLKVKARLQQAEDEFRSSEQLGAGEYPPVGLCREMGAEQVDAVLLQLASLDRQGEKHLRLLLLQRDPCLVVWDHEVPIYEHSDVLAATAEDGRSMSEAIQAFFAPSPLGTDYLGKDMLMQLVKGTEGFFLPGLLAVAIGLGLGVLLGAFAGYMGGGVDKAITFCTTLIGSFPRLVFILLVCTIPESPSMTLIGGITGALFIPQVAEAVRRRVLALKAEDFIVASRAHGLSLPRILFYHMVWLQCFPEIVRQALYLFVYVIFLETALSYLEGPGAPPEIPSWGRMLANATAAMFRGQYWHALVPTAAIVFTTLGVAALGDVIVGQAREERL